MPNPLVQKWIRDFDFLWEYANLKNSIEVRLHISVVQICIDVYLCRLISELDVCLWCYVIALCNKKNLIDNVIHEQKRKMCVDVRLYLSLSFCFVYVFLGSRVIKSF